MTSPGSPRTEVVILAAGAGRRMGGQAKCLLEFEGRSILERLVHDVHQSLQQTPILVLGHHASKIQAHLAKWPANMVPFQLVNPAPQDDTTSSLLVALRAMKEDVQAVMVLLADQPLIDAADIDAVMTAFKGRAPGYKLLVPMVNGVPGHPVIFDATVRADLLTGSRSSLRQWRAMSPQATLSWVVENGHYTRDLDTPQDVDAFRQETGWSINRKRG